MNEHIVSEYMELLTKQRCIDQELKNLPAGTISRKKIKGKTYCYLQRRVGGKMEGRYIPSEQIEEIVSGLEKRKVSETELKAIHSRITEIEKAARCIDRPLARKLQLLRLSAGMDDLSPEEKENSIVFAQAINAMDGTPASEHTVQLMREWIDGKRSYLSVFEQTLAYYHA